MNVLFPIVFARPQPKNSSHIASRDICDGRPRTPHVHDRFLDQILTHKALKVLHAITLHSPGTETAAPLQPNS